MQSAVTIRYKLQVGLQVGKLAVSSCKAAVKSRAIKIESAVPQLGLKPQWDSGKNSSSNEISLLARI